MLLQQKMKATGIYLGAQTVVSPFKFNMLGTY